LNSVKKKYLSTPEELIMTVSKHFHFYVLMKGLDYNKSLDYEIPNVGKFRDFICPC